MVNSNWVKVVPLVRSPLPKEFDYLILTCRIPILNKVIVLDGMVIWYCRYE